MANEITVQTTVSVNNGTTSRTIVSRRRQTDQATAVTAALFDIGEATVPTTAENIPYGDITTPGELYILNKDATNYLQLGFDTAGTFTPNGVKLEPGQDCRFPVDSAVTLQWRANTAAVKVEIGVVAD